MAEALSYVHRPRGAYSLQRTAARFARWDDAVTRVEDDSVARLVPAGRSLVLVRVRQIGSVARPELEVTLAGKTAADPPARRAADQWLARGLGAAPDLRGFARALRDDPLLGGAVRARPGLRIAGSYDCFEALVGAVLTQQVNLAFAFSIRRELVALFGRSARLEGATWRAFPAPARIAAESPARLRELRLSNAKSETLVRLAEAFASGALSDAELAELSDEAVVAKLVALKGIGRWTAEVGLMRGLARLDVFPAGDLAVIKHLARAAQLVDSESVARERDMRAFAERWRPYRSLALIYALAELYPEPAETGA